MISPETLRRFPFFAGVNPAMLDEIAMLGQEVSLGQGVWVFHEGDHADTLCLLLSGQIDLKINTGRGHLSALERLVPGELAGWSALIEPYVYTLGAQTVAPCTLVRIEAKGLRALVAAHPAESCKMMSHLAEIIAKRLTQMRVRFVSLIEAA